jgi:hypothetical protein
MNFDYYFLRKFLVVEISNLLQEPDSIKTGTKGRDVVVVGTEGILTGVERALVAPTSIDSTSMCVNEFL